MANLYDQNIAVVLPLADVAVVMVNFKKQIAMLQVDSKTNEKEIQVLTDLSESIVTLVKAKLSTLSMNDRVTIGKEAIAAAKARKQAGSQ